MWKEREREGEKDTEETVRKLEDESSEEDRGGLLSLLFLFVFLGGASPIIEGDGIGVNPDMIYFILFCFICWI